MDLLVFLWQSFWKHFWLFKCKWVRLSFVSFSDVDCLFGITVTVETETSINKRWVPIGWGSSHVTQNNQWGTWSPFHHLKSSHPKPTQDGGKNHVPRLEEARPLAPESCSSSAISSWCWWYRSAPSRSWAPHIKLYSRIVIIIIIIIPVKWFHSCSMCTAFFFK